MRHRLVGAALVTDTFLVQLVRLFEFAARTALRTGEFEVEVHLRQLRPAVLHNRFIRLLDNVGAVQVRPTRFVMNDSSHRDDASIRMNTRQRRLGAVLFFRLPLVATVAAFCVDRFLPERRILARLSIQLIRNFFVSAFSTTHYV